MKALEEHAILNLVMLDITKQWRPFHLLITVRRLAFVALVVVPEAMYWRAFVMTCWVSSLLGKPDPGESIFSRARAK